MANINIPGRLHSVATGNVVAGADEIMDDNKELTQSEINSQVQDSIDSLENAELTLRERVEEVARLKDQSLGLFPSLTDLQSKYPAPTVGQWALVGSTSPFSVYECVTEGTWADSGGTYTSDIDLTGYTTKSELIAATYVTQQGYNDGSLNTIIGTFVRHSNGTEGTADYYRASDYLDCSDAAQYVVTGFSASVAISTSVGVAVFYNSNKTYISGVAYISGTSAYTIDVPSTAKYVRFSSHVDMTSYNVDKVIPFAKYVDANYAKIADLDSYAKLADIVTEKPNYADGAIMVYSNSFVRAANGTVGTGNYYQCSEYIDCEGLKKFMISGFSSTSAISTVIGVAVFFDENKTYISGVAYVSGTTSYTITVPSTAKYVRFTRLSDMSSYLIGATMTVSEAMASASIDRVFISPSGSDSNSGTTENAPVATIAKAMEVSTKTLIMLPGDYDNPNFDLSSFDRIIGYGKVRIIRYRDKITSATLASGYTKVYQTTISANLSSAVKFIYQHDVPDSETAILAAEKHPLQRNRSYRMLSTRIYKAESIAAIEAATRPMWYADGTTLYFSIVSGTSLAGNPVIVPGGATSATGKKNIDIRNVAFLYTNLVLRSASGILDNVSCGMPLPSSGAFMLDYSKSLLLRNCEAYAAHTTSGGDGFNVHTSDTSISDRSCVTFENCWAHDNSDDGESCHEHCNSIHYGGLFEYNGSGITPASGGNAQCYNTLARKNGAVGDWIEDSTGTGFSAQGSDAHCQCMGCVSQNNKKGYNLSGTGSTFLAANCISQGDTTAYSSVSTTLNCLTIT